MSETSGICALLLAAGYSSRMGAFKPLLPLGPVTMLEKTVRLFFEAGIPDVRVVVGHNADEIVPAVERLGAKPILNPRFERGMLSSVVAGVNALGPDVSAFFLLPVDIPMVRKHTLRTLVEAYHGSGARIVYPCFRHLRGHPPLIAADLVRGKLTVHHEGGLRNWLGRHDDESLDVDVIDQGILTDCDTPLEYQKMRDRVMKTDVPSLQECEALWTKFHTPEDVISHCRMVAELSRLMAVHLNRAGLNLDVDLVFTAACLHDLAKGRPNHAHEGAQVLMQLGFPKVADVVASHMNIGPRLHAGLDERDLVYLADKLVRGDRMVSIEDRFDASIAKYRHNPNILNQVLCRYESASVIKDRMESVLRSPLEPLVQRHERCMRASLSSRGRLIYLARHGAVQVSGRGKSYIGQQDAPLSRDGVRQAEELSERLRDVPLSAIYCSDLSRSVESARIIARPHGIEPQKLPEMREIGLGEWEGLSFDEVARKYPREFEERGNDIVHYRPPGGESFLDCTLRVLPALYRILHSTSGDILIVGHAGVNRIILSQAMGADLKDLFKIDQEYGCLNRIAYDNREFSLG